MRGFVFVLLGFLGGLIFGIKTMLIFLLGALTGAFMMAWEAVKEEGSWWA